MTVQFGEGTTKYGPGVQINLSADEVATAIRAYLYAHDIILNGPTTVSVNGELCQGGEVYVDPSGSVISEGAGWSGRGHKY